MTRGCYRRAPKKKKYIYNIKGVTTEHYETQNSEPRNPFPWRRTIFIVMCFHYFFFGKATPAFCCYHFKRYVYVGLLLFPTIDINIRGA